MAYDSGLIAGSVSVNDVKTALGVTHNKLSELCKSGNINKWARYKPHVSKNMYSTPEESHAGSIMNQCGLVCGEAEGYDTADALCQAALAGSSWQYIKPSGGIQSPYRLGDFHNYYHFAVNPFGTFSIADIDILPYSTLNVTYNPMAPGPYNVCLADIGRPLQRLNACYFGVAFYAGGQARRYKTASKTIAEGGTEVDVTTPAEGNYKLIPFISSSKANSEEAASDNQYFTLDEVAAKDIVVASKDVGVNLYSWSGTWYQGDFIVSINNPFKTALSNVVITWSFTTQDAEYGDTERIATMASKETKYIAGSITNDDAKRSGIITVNYAYTHASNRYTGTKKFGVTFESLEVVDYTMPKIPASGGDSATSAVIRYTTDGGMNISSGTFDISAYGTVHGDNLLVEPTEEKKIGTIKDVQITAGGLTSPKFDIDVYQNANKVEDDNYEGRNGDYDAYISIGTGLTAGQSSATVTCTGSHIYYYRHLYTSGSNTDEFSKPVTDSPSWSITENGNNRFSKDGNTLRHSSMVYNETTDTVVVYVKNGDATDSSKREITNAKHQKDGAETKPAVPGNDVTEWSDVSFSFSYDDVDKNGNYVTPVLTVEQSYTAYHTGTNGQYRYVYWWDSKASDTYSDWYGGEPYKNKYDSGTTNPSYTVDSYHVQTQNGGKYQETTYNNKKVPAVGAENVTGKPYGRRPVAVVTIAITANGESIGKSETVYQVAAI